MSFHILAVGRNGARVYPGTNVYIPSRDIYHEIAPAQLFHATTHACSWFPKHYRVEAIEWRACAHLCGVEVLPAFPSLEFIHGCGYHDVSRRMARTPASRNSLCSWLYSRATTLYITINNYQNGRVCSLYENLHLLLLF